MRKIFTFFITVLLSGNAFSQSWVSMPQPFAPNRSLDVLSLNSADNFWAYSSNTPKQFAITTDGGSNWTMGNTNDITATYGQYNWNVSALTSVNETTAWVLTLHGSNLYDVWKTSDGGNTWLHQLNLAPGGASILYFFNSDTGIAIGNPVGFNYRYRIYRTVDGGATWSLLPDSSSPHTTGLARPWISFVDGVFYFIEEYFLAGAGFRQRIIKSTDLGITWSALPASFPGRQCLMAWSDTNKAVLVDQTQLSGYPTMQMHRTTDGGQTWSAIPFSGLPLSWITDISYVPGTDILLATGQYYGNDPNAHGSWISTDNGNTWNAIDPNVRHSFLRCYSVGICYSGGFNVATNTAMLFKMNLAGLNTLEVNSTLVGIHPNPTSGELNIVSKNNIKSTALVDLTGKLVIKGISKKMDISFLPKGVYVLTIQFEDGSAVTEKVIKK
ncbi:T9SS type A sorting domain-containing protein [Marnyiella aurantia]|uniref:T9SS type A sorting domain-containing protein n=1 Tax=Marnyiella aurantia TaxID=2758037 RepID=A0A7D7LPH7_9FLAO|nr:T9SS type A sorting domain-containing protein [Marnyiella aurantia]MBA5246267.1 T9SS type A sorting domain-containing protein [Marnyiella aurantia]QMS98360.1 T9SS type A sorting domain-containing protein [Marnyiella aurantia]